MRNPFVNHTQKRLRSGWRILIYFILFFTAFALAGLAMQEFLPVRVTRSIVGFFAISSITLGALWLGGRYLDRRKFTDYGFNMSRTWWLDFTFGILLSGMLFCLIFVFEKSIGWVEITGYFLNQKEGYAGLPFFVPFILGVLFFIVVGVYEEILFRGYMITNLAEGFNKKNAMAKKALVWAYILSSVIFGLFHSGNDGATFVGIINIGLMGLVFGLPYILTGELAMSIALHISWNAFQALIFGFPVSGENSQLSVIAVEQGGPLLWTGGLFGPEGGLIGTVVALLTYGIILLWYKVLKRPIALLTGIAEYQSIGETTANQCG